MPPVDVMPARGHLDGLSGATGTSYTTPPPRVSDTGTRYRVVATNREGAVTSRAAVLIVIWAHWPIPIGRS